MMIPESHITHASHPPRFSIHGNHLQSLKRERKHVMHAESVYPRKTMKRYREAKLLRARALTSWFNSVGQSVMVIAATASDLAT